MSAFHPRPLRVWQQHDCWPQQSPIAIYKKDTHHVAFSAGHLKIDYEGGPYAGTFEGEVGHRNFVLSEPTPSGKRPTIRFGSATATLEKIHLHMPSEHDLEGKNNDAEIHLLHRIEKPTAGSELIVLGVLYKRSAKAPRSPSLASWISHSAAAAQAPYDGAVMCLIDPSNFLPDTSSWYWYEGSLTSEPYSEVVTWIVFPTLLEVASEDLAELSVNADQPERPPQDVNRRFILRNFA